VRNPLRADCGHRRYYARARGFGDEAGADCVAVIRDIVCAAKPGERARRFLDALGAANHAAAI